MFDNISDLEHPFIPTPIEFTKMANGVASELGVSNMVIVGGAVRDCVLGTLVGRTTLPKDIDVILPKPISDIEKNSNIIRVRRNSLGGMKIETKKFGTIDVFQHYTQNPENIILDFFDFNCNSLFYRMRDDAIIASVFFQEFLESQTIRMQRMYCDNSGVHGIYGIPQTVMRALKFQIKFMENYNIKTDLDSSILYMIYNMSNSDEESMKKYMVTHVKDVHLQKMILQSYQNIRK